MKQKQTHRRAEQTCGGPGKGDGKGVNWEFGVSRCKLLYAEWATANSYCTAHGTTFNIL